MNFDKELFKKYRSLILLFLAVASVCFWVFVTSIPTPPDSEKTKTFEVKQGASLVEISRSLKEQNLIRSRTIFNSMVIMSFGETKIISGEYLFTYPMNMFQLVDKLTKGDYGIPTKQVLIPEGSTIKEIAKIFETNFPQFDKEAFFQLAEGKEGYLFPDTYFFLENVRAHEVVELLENTFNKRIKELNISSDSKKSLEDVVIMASIVEKEADKDSRQEVANILWKRISLDKPLQVDAPFVYSIGKGTFDLSIEDLRNDDDPYNTYTKIGLPPTPIANPGFESLYAAANPTSTPYLYFLTGRDGKMYYGKTFEDHKKNREKHL